MYCYLSYSDILNDKDNLFDLENNEVAMNINCYNLIFNTDYTMYNSEEFVPHEVISHNIALLIMN